MSEPIGSCCSGPTVTLLRGQAMGSMRPLVSVAALGLLVSCGSDPTGGSGPFTNPFLNDLTCSIPEQELFSGGVPPNAIPALENPEFVNSASLAASYLRDSDRVIGLLVEGEAWAVPHNIGWWHEIVNIDFPGGPRLAVTYCPLTGSSLVFDRAGVGMDGGPFAVSGLLFKNNLIMFDHRRPNSLWFQMMRESRCGPADGLPLEMYPAFEMTWAGWRQLHPFTRVVSQETGIDRDYQRYPYGSYEQQDVLLFDQPDLDTRRFVKERTLGIPVGRGGDGVAGRSGVLYPFEALRDLEDGPVAVATAPALAGNVVVFWDERVEGAMAFKADAGEVALSFQADGDRIVDDQTGSEWRVDGLAVSGELAGQRLPPVPEAYVAFWFAWMAFHPEAELWDE